MSNVKIINIKYFTKDKLALISEDNIKKYEKYLKSRISKNTEVKETTYKTYKSAMTHFMCFLALNYDNVDLYSEEFMNNAVDIMEDYISFCQETLMNHKKVINTKISAVSSFYIWSLKRGLVNRHPFDKKLDRMKEANNEKIINHYFLTEEQSVAIRRELELNDRDFDIQDQIIFGLFYDSANRIGAIDKLTLSSLDLDNMLFTEIREKRGYRVEVIFEERTKELIEEWLEMRKEMDNLEVDALFVTKYGGVYKQMSKSTIQSRIRKIGEIIGLPDFHAHCIRKTKLNDVYDETGDLALAAELGNHKSTETTRASYIKPKSKTEVRDKLNALKAEKLKNKEDVEEIAEEILETE